MYLPWEWSYGIDVDCWRCANYLLLIDTEDNLNSLVYSLSRNSSFSHGIACCSPMLALLSSWCKLHNLTYCYSVIHAKLQYSTRKSYVNTWVYAVIIQETLYLCKVNPPPRQCMSFAQIHIACQRRRCLIMAARRCTCIHNTRVFTRKK